jgi:hypothetical protein
MTMTSDDIHEGFLGLACAIICWHRLANNSLVRTSESTQAEHAPLPYALLVVGLFDKGSVVKGARLLPVTRGRPAAAASPILSYPAQRRETG